jgi:hypothetical protein
VGFRLVNWTKIAVDQINSADRHSAAAAYRSGGFTIKILDASRVLTFPEDGANSLLINTGFRLQRLQEWHEDRQEGYRVRGLDYTGA